MRLRTTLLLGLGLTIGALGGAQAQSLYGPGGMALFPAATTPPKGQLTPAVLALPQHVPLPGNIKTRTWISGSLDYGLTDDIEIGVTTLNITNWPIPETSVGGYAKWRFLSETEGRPSAAVGFVMTGFGGTNTREAFFALRKQIFGGSGKANGKFGVHLNGGVQYVSAKEGIPRDDFQPYGGLEIALNSRLTAIAEGGPPVNGDIGVPVAVSLAYRYGSGGRLLLTWANTGMSTSPRVGIGAGLSIGSHR